MPEVDDDLEGLKPKAAGPSRFETEVSCRSRHSYQNGVG